MGACATKPKVLKDSDEKPISQPEPLPQKEEVEVEKVAQREAENDAAFAPIESAAAAAAAKSPSLGNLFVKESEDAKVSPGNEALETLPAPSATMADAPLLPAPATMADVPVEKEAIKTPGIIGKGEDTESLQAPATMADVPVEKDINKASEEVITKEYTKASEKLAAEPATIEKMDSQASEIVPEDFADALPAPPSPVVADAPVEELAVSEPEIVNKENSNASEDVKETVLGEKSVATPPPATEAYFPADKIVSQFSEEYTDALAGGTDEVVVLNNNANANANASQRIEQTEEEVEKLNPAQDAEVNEMTEEKIPPLNIEDKKTVDAEKQIEVAESINPTRESDIKHVKSVEILPEK